MKHLSTVMIAAMAGAFAITTLAPNGLAQDAAAAFKARVDIMKSNGAANGRIAKSDDAKAIAEDAKILQSNSQKLASLWPANSMTPDSRAKAEIWQNMADFNAKIQAFQNAAGQLVAVADKGDVQAAKDQAKAVGGACGACHQAYRGPEKGK